LLFKKQFHVAAFIIISSLIWDSQCAITTPASYEM
jgi:hypothetical protein